MAAAARFTRNSHAGIAGEIFYRLGELQIFIFHEEGEGVAAGAATKAIIELFVGIDAERRASFLVERAAGRVILARLFEFDTPVYHLDDVDAVQQVIEESLGNPSSHVGCRANKTAGY